MEQIPDQIVFQVYSNQELPFQYDPNLLIFFGLHGTSRILRESTEYELSSTGILVVNPFELYCINCPEDASMICLCIPRSLLQISGWQDSHYCSCYERTAGEKNAEYRRLRELYAEIFKDFFQNSHNQTGFAGTALQLTGLLQSNFSVHRASYTQREATIQRIKRILDRIHAHWNEDISLSQIAAEEYLSVSYLSRFFKKHLHTTFSQYLTDLRLRQAAQMIAKGKHSITEISYDCGFGTPSAFIESFKQKYHCTPGQFRQKQQSLQNKQAAGLPESDTYSDMAALLSYLPEEKPIELPNRTVPVAIDCTNRKRISGWRRILNIGYARDGLLAPVQEQIRRAQREVGFEFIRFHGLLDEDMHIYGEDEQGNLELHFSYVNMLFDFILSLGLKPYVELSFMPAALAKEQTMIFDRKSIFSGCRDLKKWNALVTAVIQNFINRYGKEEVYRWKFTTISRSYMHLGCIYSDDYDALYVETYQAIKTVDPKLCFGGPGCFAYLITEENGVPLFLEYARRNNCLPDFVSIQCYPHNQSAEDTLFMNFTLSQQAAPAILSDDADFLIHSLDSLKELMHEQGIHDREIFLEECTSTLWQRDLSGDTCYKAAWLAKNVCDNIDQAVFGYWLLTDMMEERATLESVFHGGYGLFTYNGIPKAGYHAMQLLSLLGNEKVAEGKGWLLTRRADEYQLITYNYCHYSNIYRCRYKRLEKPQDAYSVFEPGEILRLQFKMNSLSDGRYRVERRAITCQHGSSFDKWIEIGAPKYPSSQELKYLQDISQPYYHVSDIEAENGLRVEVLLRPLEIELLTIRCLNRD